MCLWQQLSHIKLSRSDKSLNATKCYRKCHFSLSNKKFFHWQQSTMSTRNELDFSLIIILLIIINNVYSNEFQCDENNQCLCKSGTCNKICNDQNLCNNYNFHCNDSYSCSISCLSPSSCTNAEFYLNSISSNVQCIGNESCQNV